METLPYILYVIFLIVALALLVFVGICISLFCMFSLKIYEIKHCTFGKYEYLD